MDGLVERTHPGLGPRNAGRQPNIVRPAREEIPHEEAIRLTLARVFVAPAFLYHLEKAAPGQKSGPVSDLELASRLRYFLWSSVPDAELSALAKAGKLRKPDVLAAQARRMLQDARTRRLACRFVKLAQPMLGRLAQRPKRAVRP